MCSKDDVDNLKFETKELMGTDWYYPFLRRIITISKPTVFTSSLKQTGKPTASICSKGQLLYFFWSHLDGQHTFACPYRDMLWV